MTEQKYIDCGDMVRVGDALMVLREIVPESSSVIEKNQYQEVMKILRIWHMKLFELKMITT